VALGLAGARGQSPPPAEGRPASGFEAFRLVENLNIFDASRSGWAGDAERQAPDAISVVGTLESTNGWAVFFDGSNRSYRKVLHENDTIAGFAVIRIESSGVELDRDSKRIFVAVRQRLLRAGDGDWTLESGPRPAAAPAPESSDGGSRASGPLVKK
jgi:hypothetical protein